MNNKASLQLGGGNWAAKDANLLAYKTSLSEKSFLPIEFTFERGANLAGTRVDENGLIEKGRENLLKQSNIFNGSEWIKGNFSFLENQTDKDGGTTAWKATCSTTYNYLGQNVSGSGVYTFSGYFRKGDSNEGVRFNFSASTDTNVYIDLTDGSSTDNGNLIYKSITAAGNGFYKVVVTANLSSLATVRFFITNGGTAQVSGNIYIQQFQIEVGLVATDYIETGASTAQAGVLEDLPRIDYTGGTPSLLLEPSRTNLIPNSEYFDSWTTLGNGTVTQNYGISPEGVQNSSRFQAVTSSDRVYIGVGSVNANETFSVYMKGSGPLLIDIGGGGNNFYPNLTSEWVRYEFTTSQNGTNSNIQFKGNNGTLDVELYGAQFERNSYPTSYIPTYGATATRSDDYYSNTSLSNIGSTDRCTFYCEIDLPQGREGSPYFLRFDSPASSFGWKGNYVPSPIISVIGTGNITNSDTITVSTGVHKLIIRWENGVGSIFIDGAKKTEQITSSATEVFDEFRSQGTGYRHLQKSVLVFPETLSDAECITLTT